MKNKTRRKLISLLLCICMTISVATLVPMTTIAEEFSAVEGETKWTMTKTGDDKGVWVNTDGYLGNSAPVNDYFAPYGVGNIFDVVYYFTGTTGSDTRTAGYYSIDTTTYTPVTPISNIIGDVNYPAKVMMASSYALWPTDTYRPGFSFTAPKTGSVKFCYSTWMLSQYHNSENLLIYKNGGTEEYLIKDQKIYDNAAAYTTDVAYVGGSSEHHPYYYLEVEVKKGDVIYFIADPTNNNFDGDRLQLWINSVEYTAVTEEWTFTKTDNWLDTEYGCAVNCYDYMTTVNKDAPINYVYYYVGEINDDTREAGYYNVNTSVNTNASNNADGSHSDFIDVNDILATESLPGISYVAGQTMFASYVLWLTDVYIPGMSFTAPVSGTVKFDFLAWEIELGSCRGHDMVIKVYKNGFSDATLIDTIDTNVLEKNCSATMNNRNWEKTYTLSKDDTLYFMAQTKNGEAPSQGSTRDRIHFWFNEIKYTSVQQSTASASIIGSGLKAQDELKLRFFVQLDSEKSEAYVFNATLDGVATSFTISQFLDAEGTSGKTVLATDYIYEVIVPLAAKQMTDDVVLSVKKENIELLEENAYTVEDYCQYWIGLYKTKGENLAVAQSCAAILYYGNTIQQAQNYKTDKLPNIGDEIFQTLLGD